MKIKVVLAQFLTFKSMWMAFSVLSYGTPSWAQVKRHNKTDKITDSKTALFCIHITFLWEGMFSGPRWYNQCNFFLEEENHFQKKKKKVNRIISHANVKIGKTIPEIVSIFSTLSKDRQSLKSDAISMNLINSHSYPQSFSYLLCFHE